jgi:hypothetical protein
MVLPSAKANAPGAAGSEVAQDGDGMSDGGVTPAYFGGG